MVCMYGKPGMHEYVWYVCMASLVCMCASACLHMSMCFLYARERMRGGGLAENSHNGPLRVDDGHGLREEIVVFRGLVGNYGMYDR